MEFKFSVNDLFKQPITEINQTLIPPGFQGDRRALWDAVSKVAEVVNEMGNASAAAQGLSKPITTADRLRNSEHKIYILTDKDANNGKGAVTGMLKVGKKGLYIFDRDGQPYQTAPTCVLDFYVHESRQRHGLGRHLFEHMLQNEKVDPVKMAIDRPSDKFLGFLNKHYNLNNPIRQMNNYVVFEGFFPEPLDKDKNKGDNASDTPRRGKQPANGLQKNFSSPYGRYGAPRPPCSMGQIIHNQTSTVQKSQEPAGSLRETVSAPTQQTQSMPNSDNGGYVVNQTQSAPSVPYQQQQQYGQGYYEQPLQYQNYQYAQNVPPQQYVSLQQIGDVTLQNQQQLQQPQQQYAQPNVVPQSYQQQPNVQQYAQYAQPPNAVVSEKTANMPYVGQYAYPTISQPGLQFQQTPSDKVQAQNQNLAAYQQYYNTQSLPNIQMAPQYQQQMVYHAQTVPQQVVPQQVVPQQQEMIQEKLIPQAPQTPRQVMPQQAVSQPQMMAQGYVASQPSMMPQRQTVSEGQVQGQQAQQNVAQTQQTQQIQQPHMHHQNLQHLQQMPQTQQQVPQMQQQMSQMPQTQQMPQIQQQVPQIQQMPQIQQQIPQMPQQQIPQMPQQQMLPQISQQIVPQQQYIPQALPQGQTVSLPTIPQNQAQMVVQTPSVAQIPQGQIVPQQYIQQRQTLSQPQIGQGYVLPQTQTLSQPQMMQQTIPTATTHQYQYYDRNAGKMIQQVGGDRGGDVQKQQQEQQQNVTASTNNKPNASGDTGLREKESEYIFEYPARIDTVKYKSGRTPQPISNLTASKIPTENLQAQGERYQRPEIASQ